MAELIPMMFKPPTYVPYGERVEKSLKLREMIRVDSENKALQTAMQSSLETDEQGLTRLNRSKFLSNLLKASPQKGYAVAQAMAKDDVEMRKTIAEAEHNQLDNLRVANDFIGGLLSTVTDQTTYSAAIARAKSFGIPGVDKMPLEYNPEEVKQLQMSTLTTKDRLSLALEQKKLEVDQYYKQDTSNRQWYEAQTKATNDGTQAATTASTKVIETEKKLRTEFNQQSDTFNKVKDAYGRIQASVKPTGSPAKGASDVSLIFSYMKMLDPGSVVREGEFATAQNAASVPDRVVSTYNNVLNGAKLSPTARAAFVMEARKLYTQAVSDQRKLEQQYRGIAVRSGANPDNVTIDYRSTAEPQKSTGKVMSMADVRATAKSAGKTVDEVIAAAKSKGYTIR